MTVPASMRFNGYKMDMFESYLIDAGMIDDKTDVYDYAYGLVNTTAPLLSIKLQTARVVWSLIRCGAIYHKGEFILIENLEAHPYTMEDLLHKWLNFK